MVAKGRKGWQGKSGGRPSSGKANSRGGLRAPFVASPNDSHLNARQSNGLLQSKFCLSEEARKTEHHQSWSSDMRLRQSRIEFISAGTYTAEDVNLFIQKSETNDETTKSSFQERRESPVNAPEDLSTVYTTTPDAQMSEMTLNDLPSATAHQFKPVVGHDLIFKRSNRDNGLKGVEASREAPFVNDADEQLHTGHVAPMVSRSPSIAGSNSSGEVIIFAGRRRSCSKGDQKQAMDNQSRHLNALNLSKPSGYRSSIATMIDNPLNAANHRIESSPKHSLLSFSSPSPESAPAHPSCYSRVTTTRRKRRRRYPRTESKGEGLLDDYVANLREGDFPEISMESSIFKLRDLGGCDTAKSQSELVNHITVPANGNSMTSSDERTSAEQQSNELNMDDGSENVKEVLSSRERPSRVQNVFNKAGCTVGHSRWFPVSSHNIQGAEASVGEFESNVELHHRNGSDGSDKSFSIEEQLSQDLQDDLDENEDEKDSKASRATRMTDERVARLRSKQGKPGLGSDDLVLYDGGVICTDSQEELQLDGLWEGVITDRKSFKSERAKQSRPDLASATSFADILDEDPHNSFDMIDQHRLSLRKRAKARRDKLTIELSDLELGQSIRTAWEKDRIKKKTRKQEREQLRVLGLLGKKSKVDLKAKYSDGISTTQVKKEIRDFLLSSMESLALPPMAQGERKMVHEIASVFKLKSKSTGGGKSRFPVLYKTSRTIQYNGETLKTVDSVLSSGRFLPRIDTAKKKGASADKGRRGGAASAGISYRDGEVVGAAAPEISQANRGRTMLEKMGWSTGTALGALNNNRGLVQPVAQVVKTSRSGLG